MPNPVDRPAKNVANNAEADPVDPADSVSDAVVLRVAGLGIETTRGAAIVEDVGFEIRRGRVLGLVGESGCGKTSTALALLAHARPGTRIAGGSVELDGVGDVLQLSPAALRRVRGARIAYVPQDPSLGLNPRHKVGTQIAEALRVHGVSRIRAEQSARDLTHRVGLDVASGILGRYPFELSGGQQQRVAIAMALACQPTAIVLDEPTTGLDVATQARILMLIRDLARDSGSAFLYVSHDLAVVRELSDDVAVMYAGRIVEFGAQRLVFDLAAHPYTRLLLASVPRLKTRRALSGIRGAAPPPGSRPPGCAFGPRCPLVAHVCEASMPSLDVIGEGHLARCFRVQETRVLSTERPHIEAARRPKLARILNVEDLVAGYGKSADPVLHSVSLDLRPGECLALVGESGSGKTTLGRCVVGLHEPQSGSIHYRGDKLAPRALMRSRDQRREIQLVFQNPDRSLNPRETVFGTVARIRRLFFGSSGAQLLGDVTELVERVRLRRSHLESYPRELSGGERQRLAIARALAAEPTLLICDEITSSLDVSIQAAIVELLKELQQAGGLSLLFITHNLALVNSIADRVIVLEQGIICESGTADEVIGRPRHPYSKNLVAAAPDV